MKDAVEEAGPRIVGKAIWEKYKRWPVYSKFFDNMGPIPHHMHQQAKHAALTGQQGKPECYYFPPQLNAAENHFDYTFMGLEPGTTKADVRRCLENWDKGDNGILDLSKAYRLKAGTGWMIPAGVLHAPGSMCTYEPQWGSDVFGMYQSLVEGREVPWDLLVKDVPKDKHHDLDFIVEQLDWEKNVDPYFKEHNYVEPIVDTECSGPGYTDRWIDYGRFDGEQLVSAKELTVMPGAKCVLKDPGASGWITVQGCGRMGKLAIQTPVMIHFGEEPWDEVFITARRGRRPASRSRTPAASRWSGCATSARRCIRTCRRSGIIGRSESSGRMPPSPARGRTAEQGQSCPISRVSDGYEGPALMAMHECEKYRHGSQIAR